MTTRHPVWMLVLAACQPPLVEAPTTVVDPPDPTDPVTVPGDDDDDDDTVGPGDPIRLERVAPDFGTAGHQVLVDGGPFPDDVVIRFEGVDARILDHQAGRLLVEVPDLGDDGPVEVTAASAGGTSTDRLPFAFFANGEGRIGAIGIVETEAHVGGYWADDVVDNGRAKVILVHPTDFGWEDLQYTDRPDSCARDWEFPSVIYAQDPEVPSITIGDASDDLVLPPEEEYPWQYTLFPAEIEPGARYDLRPLVGNPDWPPFSLAGLTGEVPDEAPVVTSPDLEQDTIPPTGRSIALSWEGPYDGDLVLVLLQRQRSDGTTFTAHETVSCWLHDDGSFVVPDLWADWDPATDYVYVEVGRARRPQDAILPHNGARSGVLGVHWAIGFLDAQ